jgi:hypothetical protein
VPSKRITPMSCASWRCVSKPIWCATCPSTASCLIDILHGITEFAHYSYLHACGDAAAPGAPGLGRLASSWSIALTSHTTVIFTKHVELRIDTDQPSQLHKVQQGGLPPWRLSLRMKCWPQPVLA